MDMTTIQEWYDNNYIIYALFAIAAYGILIKWVVALIYKGLLKASDMMGTSENKLMKLLRMKFETCYKLKIGVKNVDSFVDKYIYKYRFMGILLYTWESIGGQVLIISMLAGTVAVVTSIVSQCGQVAMLSTLLASICSCALLVTAESMLNLPMKRRVLRVNIIDYLDNFLKARLENEYLRPEELDAYYKAYFTEKIEDVKEELSGEDKKEDSALCEPISEAATALDETAAADFDEGMKELMDSIFDSEKDDKKKAEDKELKEEKEEQTEKTMAEKLQIATQAYDLELERLRRQRQENEKLIHAIDNAIANRSKQLQRENVSEKESKKRRTQEEKVIEEVLKEYLG